MKLSKLIPLLFLAINIANASTCLELLQKFAAGTNEFDRLEAQLPSLSNLEDLRRGQFHQNIAGKSLREEWGEDAVELKILTYNAGMLDAPLIRVPMYKERWPLLEPAIEKHNYDIIALQEIWNDVERSEIKRYARENNYFYYEGNHPKVKKRELVLLIKKEIVDGDVLFDEYVYKTQQWYEPLKGYHKGVLTAKFKLHNGKEVIIGNTHLTALPISADARTKQAAELIQEFRQGNDYLILAGDFNTTPVEGRKTYWPLVQELKLIDSHFAVHPYIDGYTHDTVSNLTARIHKIGGSEPPKRMDYIFFGRYQPNNYYYVQDSKLIFTEDIIEPDQHYKLSDHYGVGSTVVLFSKNVN